MTMHQLTAILGPENENLLSHSCATIYKDHLTLPGPDFIERVFALSNRNAQTIRSLASLFNTGRLAGTGYLSILPVDQGVEHSAGSAFSPSAVYFDPEYILRLALEGGCNAVATTIGTLAIVARKYAHKIPFVAKLNHNELLTYPNKYDQVFFASVREAWNLGATAVGATIYFGSPESSRQITEVSRAFEEAHSLGMATILWCYLRNNSFRQYDKDYHVSADLTGQANYLGATIQADIIKQKIPMINGGFKALSTTGKEYGKFNELMYSHLSSPHRIDLCRYQVMNCYAGRIGLINSGGESTGEHDLKNALISAIINKRAGGTGLIVGRKAFQRPFIEGLSLLNSVQDIYLDKSITIA
ncbi:MAG: class I fructose-bisphosphate aldolase [Chitinophagaceae bacterium]